MHGVASCLFYLSVSALRNVMKDEKDKKANGSSDAPMADASTSQSSSSGKTKWFTCRNMHAIIKEYA